MQDFNLSIIKTRQIAAEIFTKSLVNIDGFSELEVKNKITEETLNYSEIYPEGWYSPPPSGIAVLFSTGPSYNRLKYESLRKEEYWPKSELLFNEETVAMVYSSPLNKTGALGDIGLTIYRGTNEKIKQHLKNCYRDILHIAKQAAVGMKFSELSELALDSFKNKYKLTRWVTTNSSSDFKINLGHTIPGSYETINFDNHFEKTKNIITSQRLSVTDIEPFVIPETCAFTIECRLEDINDPLMPSGYYHFIICFEEGKKTILDNYNKIFKVVGMDYMN